MAPLLQILIYPVAGGAPETPSHYEFAEGLLLTRASILWFYDQYLDRPEDATDPRFAPLLADDLSDLPPALVIVAGHDPLRDEGIAYADRLGQAGVEAELVNYEGMVHGFLSLADAVDQGKLAIDRVATALRTAFKDVS
jgi:acetyl esterase